MDLEKNLEREGFIPSSFSKRVLAYTIDEFLVSIIIFIAFFNQFENSAGDFIKLLEITNSMIFYFFILKTAYHTIFIHLYGKTIGKMVAKIRAVDIYLFDNPSWGQSFLRAVLRNFDEMFLYLGMLYALANPFTQTLHDKFSKVVVIDD
jgi:uncharacterized RDD family membrane protein YckC